MSLRAPALLAVLLGALALQPATPGTAADEPLQPRDMLLPLPASVAADRTAARDGSPQTFHTIEGTVYGSPGQDPLAGARVELSPGAFVSITSRDGRFRFEVPSNAYRVEASREGFQRAWAWIIPSLPGTVRNQDLYLLREGLRGGPRTIEVPGDIPSIRAAVHSSAGGDTVRIAPGHYVERVFVDRSITIKGASAEDTVIDASGIGSVLAVAAPNVTVRGVTLFQGDWGIYVQDDGVHIADSIVYLNQQGLRVSSSTGGLVERVAFLDNWERALHLSRTTGFVFRHNSFLGNGELAYMAHATDNVFHSNDFLGDPGGFSGDPRLQNPWDNAWSLSGRGNYWEDYRGEDLDGDGVGDTDLPHASVDPHPVMRPVAHSVDSSPWAPALMAASTGAFALILLAPRAGHGKRRGR